MKLAGAAFVVLSFAAPATAQLDPKLDMVAFFSGRTEAKNVLRIFLRSPAPLNVESVGKMEGKEFVLIDTVHEGDKPVRQRKWVTREVGPGHYQGTLSDAQGPVDIVVKGNTALIRYTMNGGLDVVQTLVLQNDGKTLFNHVSVHKFGLRFARVDGNIRKLD